jgi:hypothetical protein
LYKIIKMFQYGSKVIRTPHQMKIDSDKRQKEEEEEKAATKTNMINTRSSNSNRSTYSASTSVSSSNVNTTTLSQKTSTPTGRNTMTVAEAAMANGYITNMSHIRTENHSMHNDTISIAEASNNRTINRKSLIRKSNPDGTFNINEGEEAISVQRITRVCSKSSLELDEEIKEREEYERHLNNIDYSKYSFKNE